MSEHWPDGSFAPRVIYSYPLCDHAEAVEALNAAVMASNYNRNGWPIMSKAKRTLPVHDASVRLQHQHSSSTKMTEANRYLLDEIMGEQGSRFLNMHLFRRSGRSRLGRRDHGHRLVLRHGQHKFRERTFLGARRECTVIAVGDDVIAQPQA